MNFAFIIHWLQIHSVIFTIAVFTLILITNYLPSLDESHRRNAGIPLRDDR